ncbi:olfactory receptor class A-like protein 1 [Tachyglossus aculeatus]|uniref:olfactory receptor class A-like protein 1 n=1 Tax=Tachyglossus aculeatus TaxID=9261 RepID=UPI0018F586C8|nr:olfactory receptor class A-like protein 1 [Tachyglossus aculeatus]
MDASELAYEILFLLQIVFGVSGNVFLLLVYAHVVSTTHRLNPPDLILAHLVLANTMALLSRGIPDILSGWGLNNFLDGIACKLLLYIYRVARGLSICSTCLLSVFQAITISPSTSHCAGVETQYPKWILPSCLFSWVLNLLFDMATLKGVTGPGNSTSTNRVILLKYCSSNRINEVTTVVNAMVLSLRDLFFVGLMSAASGYMMLVLHKHHRQVRHLYGPRCSSKTVPEVRAAKQIIALVTLYVLLYGQNAISLSFLLNMKINSALILNSHNIMSFTFSAVSPFLIILGDRRVRMFWKRDSRLSSTPGGESPGAGQMFIIPAVAENASSLVYSPSSETPGELRVLMESLDWTPKAAEGFRAPKSFLSSAPDLGLPDYSKPFYVYVHERRGVASVTVVMKSHDILFVHPVVVRTLHEVVRLLRGVATHDLSVAHLTKHDVALLENLQVHVERCGPLNLATLLESSPMTD